MIARRTKRQIAVATAAALLLGACGVGPDLYDVPLPSKVSGATYPIKADFESALNLPVASPVKIDGRTVGQVSAVSTSNYVAHVTLQIAHDTKLPAGTRAEVRLTAPVGEAFVALKLPKQQEAAGAPFLASGATLGLDSTGTAPDTTDLLTGVSTAVTGGSYADLKVVVDELVIAMDGSSTTARHLLREVDTLVTSTNQHRDDIDQALDALDRLSGTLAGDTDTIAASLTKLDPAIRTLQQHEDKAVELLAALDRVEGTSRSTLDGLRGRLKHQLEATQKVVDAVIAERDTLRPMMTGVTAFADALDRATPGDFAMFDLTANLVPASGRIGAVQITPDAGTLLESDPAELVKGIQETVQQLTGPDGIFGGFLSGGTGGGH